MKKKILVASFDLAIGGVERSLIGLLEHLDYDRYDVDLLLYKHEGELFSLIPEGPNLLPESAQYSTFRKSIKQTLMSGQIALTGTRLLGKCLAEIHGRWRNEKEPGYLNIQYGWALSKPFLQKTEAEYDAAISFLWPHYVVTDKVKAKKKLGWIHTDYSNIAVNTSVDGRMWNKLDHIVAVSEECQSSFLNLFPSIRHKTTVIENIFSPSFIKTNAEHDVHDEMGAHPQRIKLMTVGRLTYAKGLDDAVKACKKLVDLGYDLEWYLIGYGPLEEEIQALIQKLGLEDRFKLLGKKSNPYPYMKTADIYVQPSRYEGKAVTVREAQTLGKPVLITNFPTAKSQVKDGFDGVITPLGVDGVVQGVRRLIDDSALRETLADNTRKTDYGNSNEIEKLYSLFEAGN